MHPTPLIIMLLCVHYILARIYVSEEFGGENFYFVATETIFAGPFGIVVAAATGFGVEEVFKFI